MPRNLHCPFSDVYESCQKKFPQAKKNLCTLISFLFPFAKGIFPEGQEGGYYCCRKCKEEIRRLRREAQNKPVLRSQGHSQLQPLGHVRTQNST